MQDNHRYDIPNSFMEEAEEKVIDESFEEICRHERIVLWAGVRDGRRIVLKGLSESLRFHPEEEARLRKEYLITAGISHPGVVSVYGFERHPAFGPVIVMEYIDGVPLNVYLHDRIQGGEKGMSLAERRRLAFEIADAISALHEAGIAHRDLKPDNVMITRRDGKVRIIDLGHGDSEDYVIYKMARGTEQYGAPEQQKPSYGSLRSDVFSFGKILEELLPQRRFTRLRRACMAGNIDERPSMAEVAGRLNPVHSVGKRMYVAVAASLLLIAVGAGWLILRDGAHISRPEASPQITAEEAAVGIEPADEMTDAQGPESQERHHLPASEMSEPQKSSSHQASGSDGGKLLINAVTAAAEGDERALKGAREAVASGEKQLSGKQLAEKIYKKRLVQMDEIFNRYGPIRLTPDISMEEAWRRDALKTKRYEEIRKISDALSKELQGAGLSMTEVTESVQMFWTRYALRMKEIDG